MRNLIENSFLIGVDPLFLPQEGFLAKKTMLHEFCKTNRFELVFDSEIDGDKSE